MRIPILLALGCYVSLPAEAAPITYSLTGTVQQVSSVVPEPLAVGQQIPIVITLDANAQATQGDAETWIGEMWRELVDAGIDAVVLLEDGREVYGPMSLSAEA